MFLSKENALRYGLVIFLASAIVVGASIFGIYNTISSFESSNMVAGDTMQYYVNTSAGQSISYTILVQNNQTSTFTAYLISPSGNHYMTENFTGGGISESMVAPQGGQWILLLHMNNGTDSSVKVHIGSMPYILEAGIYLGLTMLAIGVVLLLYHFNLERREKKRIEDRYR
ncbi:MAG: hypothetical protein M1460_02845 [Candidatus Thermoplasmatota archaeon]|nr:hypothetical protein [Candidatus Thermoplasmatota archaeon]MCL5987862.1 hypothetical protein [Candidatus Thermoplasmatota archaeon]